MRSTNVAENGRKCVNAQPLKLNTVNRRRQERLQQNILGQL